MTDTFTIEQFKKLGKSHKYGVKSGSGERTVDNITFQSKKEMNYYIELKLRVQGGEVLFFLRQVPFAIPIAFPVQVYRADFVEFWTNGEMHVIDTKGFRTQEYKRKKRLVEKCYPITVEEK